MTIIVDGLCQKDVASALGDNALLGGVTCACVSGWRLLPSAFLETGV